MNSNNKRNSNFLKQEEELLMTLVKKYKDVVECKKTDHENNRLKSSIWERIEREFNSASCNSHRSTATLITKYKNIKKRCKAKFAEEKVGVRGTGGGPPLNIEFTEAEAVAANILGSRMTGLPSCYDDDSKKDEAGISIEVIPEKVEDSEDIENIIISDEYLVELDAYYDDISYLQNATENDPTCFSESKTLKQWGGQTAPLLRTKISTPLQHATESSNINRKRKNLTDNLSNWAGGKAALNQLQEKFLREEHELNQKLKIEEHKLKMKREERLGELREEEAKLKIECLKEELAIKKLQKTKLINGSL